MQYIKEDKFDDEEDYKEKYKGIEKLVEKVENLRQDYISLCKDDDKNENILSKDKYDDLIDWTDAYPEEILLFGKKYEIKY